MQKPFPSHLRGCKDDSDGCGLLPHFGKSARLYSACARVHVCESIYVLVHPAYGCR